MAIKVTATKGGYGLFAAYLMVVECAVQKTVRKDVAEPTDAPDWEPHTVYYPETVTKATVHVYADESERMDSFGTPMIAFSIAFNGEPVGNLQDAAYRYIKDNGIPDWTVTAMVDV